jgi:hypothetical protein
LSYNDGSSIEPAKFLRTKNDLVAEFGGCSGLTPTPGTLVDPTDGKEYNDLNTGFYVDVEEKPSTIDFLKGFKETLKKRFDQKEIYITYQDINTV